MYPLYRWYRFPTDMSPSETYPLHRLPAALPPVGATETEGNGRRLADRRRGDCVELDVDTPSCGDEVNKYDSDVIGFIGLMLVALSSSLSTRPETEVLVRVLSPPSGFLSAEAATLIGDFPVSVFDRAVPEDEDREATD